MAGKRAKIEVTEIIRMSALIVVVLISVGIFPPSADGIGPHGKAAASATAEHAVDITITRPAQRSSSRTFRVALICDTDASRTRGLQGFRRLTKNEAALFVFEKPLIVSFWMGSVAYSIDIIFVDPEGKVVRVYPNCEPGSLDRYPSFERVTWVIETAAGSNIRAGDRVSIEGSRGQTRSREK